MIVDVIIILSLLLGGVIGFKKGAIKTGISFVSLVIAFILAAMFKDNVSNFLYGVCPFFNFSGQFEGLTSLNILMYEVIAFFTILSLLMIAVNIIKFVTGVVEKVLKATIILAIPSKIIGFFVGFIEAGIYVFVILYFLSLPMFNIKLISESKITKPYLEYTPFLSGVTKKPMEAVEEVYDLTAKKDNMTNKEINQKSLDILIKYKVISQDKADELIKKDKLKM